MFLVTVRQGKGLPRAEAEKAILAHGEARGENYAIRWSTDNAPAPTTVRVQAFELPTVRGGELDFAEILGKKPVVLVFWASWCGPCLQEAPHLQALHEELGDRVAVVSVAIDDASTRKKLPAVVRKLGLTYPVALDTDGAVFARYAAGSSVPLTLVLDGNGSLVERRLNYETGDETGLRATVDTLLNPPEGTP